MGPCLFLNAARIYFYSLDSAYAEVVAVSSSTTGGSSRTTGAKRDTVLFSNFERVIRLDSSGSSNFEVVDEPAAAYQNTPTAGKITGFGEKYDTCGDTQPHFCSECGEPVRDEDGELVQIGETCWRQECPRCGSGWAMRAGIPITSKMESKRKEVARQRGKSPKFHHVAIMMPTFSTARNDADDAFFQVAKGVIDEVGVNVFGGALIHHPYTGDDDDDDDLDKWKERCFSGRDWEGDVEDELKEWHHIHALVLADSIDHLSCEALHDKTGILTNRIQDNDDDTNVSLYGVQDLAEAATYSLSHARLADDADAYRYFGEVANHSADHRIEARCREVVRSIVPKTLDLQPAGYLCDREIGREEVDKLPSIQRYQNDDSDDQEEQTDDSEDASEDTDTDNESTQESTEAAESDEQDTESDDGEDTQSTTEDDTVESDENTDEDIEDKDSTDSDATEDCNGGCGVHCNGRLVPFEYAPSFLDDDEQELEYEDELRAAYDEWSSPDNQDITSFAPPE